MNEELNFNYLFFIILRRWYWILLSTLIGLTAFLLYSMYAITPQYESSIELYVRNVPTTSVAGDGIIAPGDLSTAKSLVETYIVILENDDVKEQIVKALDNRITVSELDQSLSLTAVKDTEVLRVSAMTEDPNFSAEICNVVAQLAPGILKRVVKAGAVEVIAEAKPATSPSKPNVPRNSAMGALAGLLLSVSVIFLVLMLDNTVKGEEDLQKWTDVPVLGEIPSMGKTKMSSRNSEKSRQRLVHKNHVVEAYKMVRANLLFTLANAKNNIIIISSAEPSAGKSTTSANIGIAMALTGARVLLVDGDMRRPTLHQFFKLTNVSGLSELLSRSVLFEDLVHKGTHLGNLDVLTAGQAPPNPSELLGTERMAYFLKKWSNEYDYIFIDTPPVNVVADSLMLVNKVAGVVLIARQKQTHYNQLRKAIEGVKNLDAPILGLVVSDVNWKQKPYSYGQYRYSNYNYSQQSYYYHAPNVTVATPEQASDLSPKLSHELD